MPGWAGLIMTAIRTRLAHPAPALSMLALRVGCSAFDASPDDSALGTRGVESARGMENPVREEGPVAGRTESRSLSLNARGGYEPFPSAGASKGMEASPADSPRPEASVSSETAPQEEDANESEASEELGGFGECRYDVVLGF